MDNEAALQMLREALSALSVTVPGPRLGALLSMRDELMRWNERINLTAITDPREVLEKHFVDSLAVLADLGSARSLLDLGSGAGFPGLPLKIARPDLDATLVDSASRKVAFIKTVIASLGLEGARAIHARARGAPDEEGVPQAEVVVSRALMDPGGWVPLASNYVVRGGQVIAMLGQAPERATLEQIAGASGMKLVGLRQYRLPWSGAARAVACFT